ncbi:BatA domain-containing protein [Lutibacter flavus]|uniref:N-terminal double-transmembrane domain-containing protein n=1 Tax=Lutibacter flavus TaxID=691689 RepID=A0A238VBY4_9FLAO|nr:BatA domain-containing protein [Lutibacter flavus]SNR31557.1 N-terminal double-transmembrane domain-containing protein [Lutibacter flavus]
MQFKHPEILYALLFLIIPIIVHLFQLQRFVKVPFTNVKFLKNIEKQTRKSARLKKWLILLTRMLAFACLIIAFSQPFLSEFTIEKNYNTTIYLDNSYSMQAKGENGELLKTIAQNIIEKNNQNNTNLSIFTNDKSYTNLETQNLKNELINIKYSPNRLDLNTVLLKLNNLNNNKTNTLYKNILISDFQNINRKNSNDFTNVIASINLLKVTPKTSNNILVDSLYIESKTTTEIIIKVIVKSTNNITDNVPVSLLEGSKLIGKTTSKFNNSKLSIITFTVPNSDNFNGQISLIDENLEFDNDFFFSISKPEKINVLNIGSSGSFLSKIYTKNEFNYSSNELQNLNYNSIQNQHLILLNELEKIPTELINSLNEFSKNGGDIVVIPSVNSNIESYNRLLNSLQIGTINSKIATEHKITTINYDHPLIIDVFEKRVSNFQYPKTSFFYKSNLRNATPIIKFDNNESFITSINLENSNFYWVASPLKNEFSDFIQSPLVVPVFYNFAKNSSKFSKLYYVIGPETKIDLLTSIGKDDVLKISNEDREFIPLQQLSQNKVTITIKDNIIKSGFYNVFSNNKNIKTLAFNYNRAESDLNYTDINLIAENNKNISISSSISEVFEEINKQGKINWLFKWFLAFSALFLLIEILILKYFNI